MATPPYPPFNQAAFDEYQQSQDTSYPGDFGGKGFKQGIGDIGNPGAIDGEDQEVFPLITPEFIKTHMLFGIPLVSGMPDPITGKAMVMTDELIKEHISRAIGILQTETDLSIMPKTVAEKHAFDRNLYNSFNFIALRQRPCVALISLQIVSSDNKVLFTWPLDWIDIGQLQYGQINTVPLSQCVTSGGAVQSSPGNSAFFVNLLSHNQWIPSWHMVTYRTGFPNGRFPREINELIGSIAAIEILAELAATHARVTSKSISIDGQSQSSTGPGPTLFDARIKTLQEKRAMLVGRVRAKYGTTMYSDNL
jgi:hypothetical protein